MKSKKKSEPNLYRFMCVKIDNMNYHIDFTSYNEAVQYVNDLNDAKIAWYGLYELESSSDRLKPIIHKRLISHEDCMVKRKH